VITDLFVLLFETLSFQYCESAHKQWY